MHQSPKWLPHPVHHRRWICRFKIWPYPTGALLYAADMDFPVFWIGWKEMFGGRSWQLRMIRRSYSPELQFTELGRIARESARWCICMFPFASIFLDGLPPIHGKIIKVSEKQTNMFVSDWFQLSVSEFRISGPDGRLYLLQKHDSTSLISLLMWGFFSLCPDDAMANFTINVLLCRTQQTVSPADHSLWHCSICSSQYSQHQAPATRV